MINPPGPFVDRIRTEWEVEKKELLFKIQLIESYINTAQIEIENLKKELEKREVL